MPRKKFVFSEEQEQFMIKHWNEYTINQFKKEFNYSWGACFNKAVELGLELKNSVKWAPCEEEELKNLADKYGCDEIARKLNRTETAVYLKARRMGIEVLKEKRKWTAAEERKLQDRWGEEAIEKIARRLDRTVVSVRVKAIRMKLGPMREGSLDKIRVAVIANILGVSERKVTGSWVLAGLRLKKQKITSKHFFLYASLGDLVKFLKENQTLWDSRSVEKYILGGEPEWLKQKRRQDLIEPPSFFRRWTDAERETAKTMLLEGYNYDEIGVRIKRTKEAVSNELNKMRLAYRLKRFWKGEELKKLNELYRATSARELADLLDRTPKAIFAKTSEMGIKKKVLLKK